MAIGHNLRFLLKSRIIFGSYHLCLSAKHLHLSSNLNGRSFENGIHKSPYTDIEMPNCSLTELMFNSMKQNGNKTAIIDATSNIKWTYSHLLDQTVKASIAFQKMLSLKKGDTVVIISPNSPQYALVYLALIANGIVPSTINPAVTEDELKRVCKEVEAKYVFTTNELAKTFEIDMKFVIMDETNTDLISLKKLIDTSTVRDFDEKFDYGLNDNVVIPYSSGTSGLPKGVQLTNMNIISNLHQIINSQTGLYDCMSNKKILAILPFFHIYGQVVIFLGSIFSGGTFILLPRFEPQGFINCLNQYQPSCLYLVPPLLHFLSHEFNKIPDFTKFVEIIVSGAAPLSVNICEKLKAQLNFQRIINAYGLTETSPVTHINPINNFKYDKIGFSLPNTLCKLVDTESQQVINEFNKEGELCIKGPQVMKGYLKNTKATNQVIKDGWFHTGDAAKISEDGYFQITDRLKELIKYKGNQVAPAELENILLGHEFVMDVAVVGKKDEVLGELPTAFVVLKKEFQAVDHQEINLRIQEYVANRVTKHMELKGGVIVIDQIPKSPSGKILRRLLREKLESF